MGVTRTGIDIGPGRFDEATSTHRFEYDEDEISATMAVVTALAKVSGEDPTETVPIQESVDSDALDVLTRSTDTGDVHVTLETDDYTVTIKSDGVVAIGNADDAPPAPSASEDSR